MQDWILTSIKTRKRLLIRNGISSTREGRISQCGISMISGLRITILSISNTKRNWELTRSRSEFSLKKDLKTKKTYLLYCIFVLETICRNVPIQCDTIGIQYFDATGSVQQIPKTKNTFPNQYPVKTWALNSFWASRNIILKIWNFWKQLFFPESLEISMASPESSRRKSKFQSNVAEYFFATISYTL